MAKSAILNWGKFVVRGADGSFDQDQMIAKAAEDLQIYVELNEADLSTVQGQIDDTFASVNGKAVNRQSLVQHVLGKLGADLNTTPALTARIQEVLSTDRYRSAKGPGGGVSRRTDAELSSFRAAIAGGMSEDAATKAEREAMKAAK